MSRAAEICEALGLEFYVGPPRGAGDPDLDRPLAEATETSAPPAQAAAPPVEAETPERSGPPAEAMREQMASILKVEAQAIREEICEGVRRELAGISWSSPTAGDLEDAGALAVGVVAEGARDVPGARPVQMAEIEAAAGGGAYNLDEAPVIGPLWFRRDWIDSQGIDPTHAAIISVRNESMEPTLTPGCKILIDRNRRRRRVGHIYVITTADGLIVKRMGKDADGGWLLVSDNDSPDWPDLPCPDDAEIIGQVVWTARTLIGQQG